MKPTMRFFGQFVQHSLRLAALGAFLVILACPFAHAQAKPADPPPKPAADVLIFTNGDRLTGILEKGTGSSVVFKSDMTGEITVPLDKIKELRTGNSFAVLRKDHPIKNLAQARQIHPAPIAYADGQVTVTPPAAPPQVVPTPQLAYLIDKDTYIKETTGKSGFLAGWTGALSGGATIVRSTDFGETFTAGINMVRTMPTVSFLPPRDKTSFNVQETYGKLTSPVIPPTNPPTPAAVTETSIFHADAERDEYFSDRFFALAQTAFDHNYAQGLRLQDLFGGGIGWTAIRSPRQELDIKGSVQYENQQFFVSSGTPDQDLIGSTFSESYHRNLPHKLVLTEGASFIPAWNVTRDYSANGDITFAIPVFKRLSLTLSTTDSFLNDPAAYYKKNSYQFITAVSYTLK